MIAAIPYFNGIFTLTENGFNILGYLPKHQFPQINAWSTKWRHHFALSQMTTGVALFALGFLVDCLTHNPDKQKYLTLAQQTMSLGLFYMNHGVFNSLRSYIESRGWSALTGAYDFYGRKVLPPLSIPFDLQGELFERIRQLLDRIQFVTFFPPQISLRT